MISLSKESIAKIDKTRMYERVISLPDHFMDALQRTRNTDIQHTPQNFNGIVVAGMGGSAISGDFVRGLMQDSLTMPFLVSRSYDLPAWVNEKTLVIVSSYSGNTEETFSALNQAWKSRAQIVCISSGGKICAFAKEHRLPLYNLPEGFPPRSAIAHLIVPLLVILHRLGLTTDPTAEISETVDILRDHIVDWGYQNEGQKNIAKQIAFALKKRVPIIYSATGLFETVALRWKGQFCENAKVLSWHNVFSELNHNEMVGWGLRREFDRSLQVIFLRDKNDHSQIQKRMDLTQEVIEESSKQVIQVWSQGETHLARLFSLTLLGDLASVYLGILNGIDPTPVERIEQLKMKLEKLSTEPA